MPVFVREVVITGDIRGGNTVHGNSTPGGGSQTNANNQTPQNAPQVTASLAPDMQRRLREMIRAEIKQSMRRLGEK